MNVLYPQKCPAADTGNKLYQWVVGTNFTPCTKTCGRGK